MAILKNKTNPTKSAKKATRKTSKRASGNARSRKKVIFGSVSPDKHFMLSDGRTLKHYLALADLLEALDKGTFEHHVNASKNDFASWIDDVFNEHELADKLRQAKDVKQMRYLIYKHIVDKHIKR